MEYARTTIVSTVRSILAAAALVALLAFPARADLFDDGLAAAEQGDFAGAVTIWTSLAKEGHAEAQYRLGFAYAGGWGVPEDQQQAAVWYQRAADQGHLLSLVKLGHMHADGRHFAPDDAAAAELYRLAADAGNAEGQYYLGGFYYEGRGVSRDFGEAYRLWQLAAAQGHEGARAALCAEIADFCRD